MPVATPPQRCRRCHPAPYAGPGQPPEHPRVSAATRAAVPSGAATRCARCWRHRAGTLPQHREHAAAERRADATAEAGRRRAAAFERCELVRDNVAYAAALAERHNAAQRYQDLYFHFLP